jgi:hypothetical protein
MLYITDERLPAGTTVTCCSLSLGPRFLPVLYATMRTVTWEVGERRASSVGSFFRSLVLQKTVPAWYCYSGLPLQ